MAKITYEESKNGAPKAPDRISNLNLLKKKEKYSICQIVHVCAANRGCETGRITEIERTRKLREKYMSRSLFSGEMVKSTCTL